MSLSLADLRDVEPRQMAQILAEEASSWLTVLKWDYRPVSDFLLKFIGRRQLPGFVVLDGNAVAGYAYMVLDGRRGIIGGLYVARKYWSRGLESQLAAVAAQALKATKGVERIEAQLMVFSGADVRPALAEEGFECFARHFLSLPLGNWRRAESRPPDLELRPWRDGMIDAAAQVVFESYRGGFDAYFSTPFARKDKCRDFIVNLVRNQGCGDFLPGKTTVGYGAGMGGVVIATELSRRVGHLPQISVAPEAQGRRWGAFLVDESLSRFKEAGYGDVSLTVTEANEQAYGWYRRIGFREVMSFDAFLWKKG